MHIVILTLLFSLVNIDQSFVLAHPTLANRSFTCDISQTGCKSCKRADGTENKPANVTEIELDRSELRLPPKKESDPPADQEHSRKMVVEVTTKAEDPEDDLLTYNYTVSGGRIVGTGSRVHWDLNGLQGAGTYTITAAVDDGCGLCGKTVTQTVTIVQD